MERTKMCGLAILLVLAGCASAATTTSTATTTPETTGNELLVAQVTPAMPALRDAPDSVLPEFDAETLASLPQAPWTQARIATSAMPGAVLSTWAGAENRTWCAPLVPETDADVRASNLDGGWVFEFDTNGEPSSFGVAGTAMGLDEMIEEPVPAFADGSATDVMEEEGIASATIAIRGQGCVYQVWSTQGAEHLEQMLGSLRFVEVPAEVDAVAGLDVY